MHIKSICWSLLLLSIETIYFYQIRQVQVIKLYAVFFTISLARWINISNRTVPFSLTRLLESLSDKRLYFISTCLFPSNRSSLFPKRNDYLLNILIVNPFSGIHWPDRLVIVVDFDLLNSYIRIRISRIHV